MRSLRLLEAGALALLIMASPALAQGLACNDPQKPMLEIDLMFGRNIGSELGVSEGLWSDFVASEIMPRFPEGLTVLDAPGQWQDKERNTIVKGPSKHVRLIVPADAEVKEKLDSIVTDYKQRFQQQGVGIVIRPACVSL